MVISLIAKICIIAGSVIVGLASTIIFKMKKDNPVEEAAEEVIKENTGMSVDLSPDSPEETKEK